MNHLCHAFCTVGLHSSQINPLWKGDHRQSPRAYWTLDTTEAFAYSLPVPPPQLPLPQQYVLVAIGAASGPARKLLAAHAPLLVTPAANRGASAAAEKKWDDSRRHFRCRQMSHLMGGGGHGWWSALRAARDYLKTGGVCDWKLGCHHQRHNVQTSSTVFAGRWACGFIVLYLSLLHGKVGICITWLAYVLKG